MNKHELKLSVREFSVKYLKERYLFYLVVDFCCILNKDHF